MIWSSNFEHSRWSENKKNLQWSARIKMSQLVFISHYFNYRCRDFVCLVWAAKFRFTFESFKSHSKCQIQTMLFVCFVYVELQNIIRFHLNFCRYTICHLQFELRRTVHEYIFLKIKFFDHSLDLIRESKE